MSLKRACGGDIADMYKYRSKFNSCEIDPKCPLGHTENEDLQEFILECPVLSDCIVGDDEGSLCFCTFNNDVVSLVINCQVLVAYGSLPNAVDS